MNWFAENRCQLCSKVFCCVDCRKLHQIQLHKIEPDCEICVYGRATIQNITVSVLSHIKTSHWPLHCVFCKKEFKTLDELVPHDKCTMNLHSETKKIMPNTPITPVDNQEVSLVVTPFYKISVPGNLQPGISSTIGATSTPLQPTEEKITPINPNQDKLYKSNLKLTGSTGLSDSKKLERRVTFCETPSFSSEPYKKEKKEARGIYLEECTAHESKDLDDSYISSLKENIYKTPPTYAKYEKENIDNENLIFDKTSDISTCWASALTHFEYQNLDTGINNSPVTCQNNLDLQVKFCNQDEQEELFEAESKNTLWKSVTSMMRSVVNNIPTSNFTNRTLKRPYEAETVNEEPDYKKMKLTELKCRRPIRSFDYPLGHYNLPNQKADKATQTEDDPFYTPVKREKQMILS